MIVLKDLLEKIENLSKDVTLIAVSKNVTCTEVRELYAQGQRDFGENRVQELAKKELELQNFTDIKWHMIGRLQNNKINQIYLIIKKFPTDTPRTRSSDRRRCLASRYQGFRSVDSRSILVPAPTLACKFRSDIRRWLCLGS